MGYDKIPRQKLSITKKNKEWREACVEAYVDLSNSGSGFSSEWISFVGALFFCFLN